MTHKLIHTPNHLLVVDDSEIKEGDWCFLSETSLFNAKIGRVNKNVISDNGKNGLNFKKIIAHLPLNNSPILEGVDLLPLLPQHHEDNVKELAREYCQGVKKEIENQSQHIRIGILGGSEIGFIDGYNKAKEKYKYTEEDMRMAISETRKGMLFSKTYEDEYIQSLNLPKMPIAFECEIQYFYMSSKYYYGTEAGWVKCDESQYESIRKEIPACPLKKVHKETITPEGHTQWVGKYIY